MPIRTSSPRGRAWLTSDGRFTHGKYKGELASDIAYSDPGYLSWVLREVDDLDEEDRRIIETLFKRVV